MKIIHYLHGRCSLESPHGVDKTVYYLTRSLAAAGADVSVYCLTGKPPKPIPGVEVRGFPPMRNPFSLSVPLRDAIVRARPDFLHLHSSYQISNIPLARFARSIGLPYAVTAHGNLSGRLLRRKPLLKVPYKYLFEQPFFNGAAFVHAISDMDDIRAYGVTRPLVIARNGFDLADLPAADPEAAERLFPDFVDKRLLLFLGRLDIQQKGLDNLLRAFARIAGTRPDAHLALAGPDWKGSLGELRQLAGELGIADAVTFCGTVTGDAKFHLMGMARAFVHPSRWEAGLPFSVLEALATGCPCLVSRDADPDDLVASSGAGHRVETDPGSLADSLPAVLDAPQDALDSMSRAARDLIGREFPWERSAAILLAAYREFSSLAGAKLKSAGSNA